MNNTATAQNKWGEMVTAEVGSYIYFKADVEQGGKVKAIREVVGYGYLVQVDNAWIPLTNCWNEDI